MAKTPDDSKVELPHLGAAPADARRMERLAIVVGFMFPLVG